MVQGNHNNDAGAGDGWIPHREGYTTGITTSQLRWVWEAHKGRAGKDRWSAYPRQIAKQIEEGFQKFASGGTERMHIKLGQPTQHMYVLDFVHKTQAPIHAPARTREVQRQLKSAPSTSERAACLCMFQTLRPRIVITRVHPCQLWFSRRICTK